MADKLISPDKYIRITGKTHFVGDEETRLYHNELVLQREFIHPEKIARLCEKHPNLTAIHCMISETNCNWCNPKFGNLAGDLVLRYNLNNPSVVPGAHQWVRAELRNKYFTPWYYAGCEAKDSIFKICYAVNSLGDNCILATTHNKEFNSMLNYFDGDYLLIEQKIPCWIASVKEKQNALIKQASTTEKQK